MSKLNIDQKTIAGLFADKKSDFLIQDYQRPYAWEDIFNFAFPDKDYIYGRYKEEIKRCIHPDKAKT